MNIRFENIRLPQHALSCVNAPFAIKANSRHLPRDVFHSVISHVIPFLTDILQMAANFTVILPELGLPINREPWPHVFARSPKVPRPCRAEGQDHPRKPVY
ncbi:MAG: hypothetical protein ACREWG_10800 [Gammaproteobacteria bacterium]